MIVVLLMLAIGVPSRRKAAPDLLTELPRTSSGVPAGDTATSTFEKTQSTTVQAVPVPDPISSKATVVSWTSQPSTSTFPSDTWNLNLSK